jgi:hypothetical protein
LTACAREDPARVALRERLKDRTQLSPEELGQVLDEIGKSMQGKTIKYRIGASPTADLPADQMEVTFGMLKERAGVFDEALVTEDGSMVRIINAPGRSLNAEYEASRRLFVDIETFLPRRFRFSHSVAGIGDYEFDLILED